MPSAHRLETTLAAAWPPELWRDVTVLVAVSGGADSVALLRGLRCLKTGGAGRLCAAHFNHHLRGNESAADEAFVVDLCARLGVPCQVGHAEPGAITADSGDGLEAAARTARYDFLQQTAEQLGARYVATAHTADDQAETILHRIVRGTGIAGLAGISRIRPLGPAATLIRPLLGVRRAELVAYLEELRQPYRGDSSNNDPRFTRNRIRRQLLPQLARDFNAGVTDALLRLGALAGEVQAVIDTLVQELADRCVVRESSGIVRIDATALARHPRYVVRELLIATWRAQGWPMQAMGFAQWELLAAMADACIKPGSDLPQKQAFPGNVSAQAQPGQLVLQRSACSALPWQAASGTQ